MATSGRVRRWLGALRSEGYPRWALVFLVIAATSSIYFTWLVWVGLPHERAIIDHGARATAHATTYVTYSYWHRVRTTEFHADLTWRDANGHPRGYEDLWIGEHAFRQINADRGVTKIRYDADDPGARPIIVSDIGNREDQQGAGKMLFGASVLGLLFGLYYFRRRIREWRAEQAAISNPQKPWWFG